MAGHEKPQPRPTSPLTVAWLLLTLAAVAAVSIPSLGAGYGADDDAWLVARAAHTIWQTGHYAVSRFPGYPLHEIISAPLVAWGGCVASNAGTLCATVCLLVVWYAIARKEGRNPRTLFLSLAGAPLLLTNAATTMDYLWSLLFVLAALAALLSRRVILAGICTGIAAGFRLSNLTVSIPLLVYVLFTKEIRTAYRAYLASVLLASVVALLPLLLTYGPLQWLVLTRAEMSDVHPPLDLRLLYTVYRMLYALGPLAMLALGFILARNRDCYREAFRRRDALVVSSAVAIILFGVQFVALPLDRAYLLPALPFLLLLTDRCCSARASLILLLCIVSLNLINPDIARHEGRSSTVSPHLHEGRLAESWRERIDMEQKWKKEGIDPR